MSKHTTGKWMAESDGEYWNVVVEGGQGFGREVVGCEGLYRCDGSEEANARLIAAAPDLLEALVALETLLAPLAYDSTQKDWLNRACAAIAKATGE